MGSLKLRELKFTFYALNIDLVGVFISLSGVEERFDLLGNLGLVCGDANLSNLLEFFQLLFFVENLDFIVALVLLLRKFVLARVFTVFSLFLLDILSKVAHFTGLGCVSVTLGSLSIVLDFLFLDFVVDCHGLKNCSLSVLLPELCLHVREEGARQDAYVRHLHSFKVDAPAFNDLTHILDNLLAELLAVLDDFLDC